MGENGQKLIFDPIGAFGFGSGCLLLGNRRSRSTSVLFAIGDILHVAHHPYRIARSIIENLTSSR